LQYEVHAVQTPTEDGQYSTVQTPLRTVQYSTVQTPQMTDSTVQYSTVQYSTDPTDDGQLGRRLGTERLYDRFIGFVIRAAVM
jgi:hypothetical protein